jgi:phage anti-repressor protein
MIVVNVERGMVGGVACEVVDGSELHAKLGSGAHFRDWIKDRVRQLKLVKNQDFGNFAENSAKPGRPPVGYTLTLIAAKKIAMAEHTDAGNAVRDYFLDRERISYVELCSPVIAIDSGPQRS